jgi:hypothetical protein
MFIELIQTINQSSSVRNKTLTEVHIALLTERGPDSQLAIYKHFVPTGRELELFHTSGITATRGILVIPNDFQMELVQLLWVYLTRRVDHKILS